MIWIGLVRIWLNLEMFWNEILIESGYGFRFDYNCFTIKIKCEYEYEFRFDLDLEWNLNWTWIGLDFNWSLNLHWIGEHLNWIQIICLKWVGFELGSMDNTMSIVVTTLTLGSQPRQGHGKVWAESAIWEARAWKGVSWKCNLGGTFTLLGM
jgi:hypothetical protein